MAAEVIAFIDLFDVAAALPEEISLLAGTVPVQLLTDGKRLFDVMPKGLRTPELKG